LFLAGTEILPLALSRLEFPSTLYRLIIVRSGVQVPAVLP
jgi:hypothetical protein